MVRMMAANRIARIMPAGIMMIIGIRKIKDREIKKRVRQGAQGLEYGMKNLWENLFLSRRLSHLFHALCLIRQYIQELSFL